jgi:hypothetical protein
MAVAEIRAIAGFFRLPRACFQASAAFFALIPWIKIVSRATSIKGIVPGRYSGCRALSTFSKPKISGNLITIPVRIPFRPSCGIRVATRINPIST